MAPSYRPGLTLERIDNNRGYSLQNCKWATRKEQIRNREVTILIEHMGQNKSLTEWCEELGLSYHTVWQRIKRLGWAPQEALGLV